MIKVSKKIRVAAMLMSLSLTLVIMGVASVCNSVSASAMEAGTVDVGGVSFHFTDKSENMIPIRTVHIDFKEMNEKSFSDVLSYAKHYDEQCTRGDLGDALFSAVPNHNKEHFDWAGSSKRIMCTEGAINEYLKAGNTMTARFYVNYVWYHESAWTGYLTINPNEDHDVYIDINTISGAHWYNKHKATIKVSDTHGSVSASG